MPRKRKTEKIQRRTWLRWLAIAGGIAVMLGHVYARRESGTLPPILHIDWEDLFKHFIGMALFALAYRLSYIGAARIAARNTVLFCCSWGAACEIIQHWIPGRDFSVIELAANIAAPLFVVALYSLLTKRIW